MRKIFVAMMLAVALVFVGSQAEAREVYVGTYSDGTDVYILTEQQIVADLAQNYAIQVGLVPAPLEPVAIIQTIGLKVQTT